LTNIGLACVLALALKPDGEETSPALLSDRQLLLATLPDPTPFSHDEVTP